MRDSVIAFVYLI